VEFPDVGALMLASFPLDPNFNNSVVNGTWYSLFLIPRLLSLRPLAPLPPPIPLFFIYIFSLIGGWEKSMTVFAVPGIQSYKIRIANYIIFEIINFYNSDIQDQEERYPS
jgi:hypothetical protein